MNVMEQLNTPTPARSTARSIISCRDLTKVYVTGTVTVEALKGVSLDIPEGQFVAVMGASGSGKSTFMNMVGALDTPTSGQILVDGKDIATLTSDELAQLRNETIGFVFQQFNLLARTSALDNVRLPLLYALNRPEDAEERCIEALKTVGLGERMDHHPSQLSGGQQQRVAIARALAGNPRFLLADEPTGNLDSEMAGHVMQLLEEINREGTTIVMVTHDPDLAARAQRNIYILDGHASDLPSLHPDNVRTLPDREAAQGGL